MSEIKAKEQVDRDIVETFRKYGVKEYHVVYRISDIGLFYCVNASQILRDHIALTLLAESIAKRQDMREAK